MTKLESGSAGRHASFLTTFAVLLAACASQATGTTRLPASITIVSGSQQSGFTGLTLSQPLVVKVTAADGTPVAGQTVDFAIDSGQATVDPASAVTDVNGLAQTQVTIGSSSGTAVEVVATVRQTSLKTAFEESAQPLTTSLSCTTANIVTLAVGETRTSLAGSGICLRASVAGEYMVNGFFASSVPSAQTQVGITGFSTTTVGTSAAHGANSNGLVSAATGSGLSGSLGPARQLELRLRRLERNVLAPRMGGARLAMRRRAALRASAPPTVGQILQLNVDEGCDSTPRYRFGRVAAVTNSAIVIADTGNPAGGFTDADYQSVGVTFDTLVNPLDTTAFGAPTDIDGNGRIILFYTRAVNELTLAHSQGVVEGFFNPRDLFPTTDPDPNNACSESNFAEMFYLIVPDPNGTINGNIRTKAEVQQLTIGVTAHEYQHLINAARRIYVNTAASAFEEVWLNEGLSHIAEELLYYRVTGLAPRQNLDGTTIAATQALANVFNAYAIANIDRYELFLDNPLINSPYADNDSLATRGATWNFLRYAADRQGTSDGAVWRQLVNSTTTGFQNLTNVLGANIMDQFRDWSVSIYTDDRAATSATYQEPSWNFRSVEARLGVTPYPLMVFPLTNGVQATQTLSGGGSLYTTLGVPANVTAAVGWSVTSPSVQISIVRTK
jgi:hypothetical protein